MPRNSDGSPPLELVPKLSRSTRGRKETASCSVKLALITKPNLPASDSQLSRKQL